MRKLNQEQFIKNCYDVHLDIFDYSKVKYINGKTKIVIICKTHGEFLQFPNNHLSGRGCPKCGTKNNGHYKKHNLQSFIDKANSIHNYKYDYSLLNESKLGSRDKIIIICKIHGEYKQNTQSHFNGHGCWDCGNILTQVDISRNMEKFINKAKNNHNSYYDYSLVNYINSKTKVKIICPKHGIFEQSPNSHLRWGCSKCGKLKITNSLEDFIKLANKKHHQRYDYSQSVYITNKLKIKIICKLHGEFLQKPHIHLNGSGCPECAEVKKLTLKDFIDRAHIVHHNTFDYSETKFISLTKKVKIKCKVHGEFEQSPNNHLLGNGCFKCNVKQKLTWNDVVIKSNKIHKNKYSYEDQNFKNVKDKIKITCFKHGNFFQRISAHLLGQGCPKCSRVVSKLELKWLDSLNIPKENHNKFIMINGKRYQVDGLDGENKIIYEFYGDFYHGNPKIYPPDKLNIKLKKTFGELHLKTLEREKIFKSAGYNVISIWESEFK
jgi:hypothetical protein